jgi:hypothetical protein
VLRISRQNLRAWLYKKDEVVAEEKKKQLSPKRPLPSFLDLELVAARIHHQLWPSYDTTHGVTFH